MSKRPKVSSVFSLLLVVALILVSCEGKKASLPGEEPTAPNPSLPTATIRSGQVSLKVELATTADQRERGLMFRKSLADGEGMLFVFDADQALAFWMKNTKLPLSVAYLASDGTIREIHDLEPESLAAVQSASSLRYALEVPAGWFGRVGLKAGDRFELPSL
jgi:uncharacterized membrane protein (UPF0127 family)